MYHTTIRIQVKGRTRPAPVRSTVVLFDGGHRRRVPGFGRGILPYRPSAKLPCTVGDLAWATKAFSSSTSAELDAAEERYNEIIEQRYLESAVLDRYTNGWTF